MNALTRLQDKIRELKAEFESVKRQNEDMQAKLIQCASFEDEKQSLNQRIDQEVQKIKSLENTISQLKNELSQKDAEIEKIIAQVEALLA
jgi:predicted  nucleic acid-binding Zn-ribbon protein